METKFVLRAGPTFHDIAKELAMSGYAPANPIASIGWTAEVEGQTVGLIVVQSVPVIYPLIVKDGWRGQGVGTELIKKAASYIINQTKAPRVLAHTNHPGIQNLIVSHEIGMQYFDEQLFEWVRKE